MERPVHDFVNETAAAAGEAPDAPAFAARAMTRAQIALR